MLRINKLYLPYVSGDIVPGLHSVISKEKQIMQVLYNILLSDYTCEKQNLSGPSQWNAIATRSTALTPVGFSGIINDATSFLFLKRNKIVHTSLYVCLFLRTEK